jgi:transcriptional regulator with XRE-family HTH domain
VKTFSPPASLQPIRAEAPAQHHSPSRARTVPISPVTIGARIRLARMAAQKTQQELAGEYFSKSYISAIERGKMTPSFKALSILAERLGLTISFLLGEDRLDEGLLASEPQADDSERVASMLNQAREAIEQGRYEAGIALCEEIGKQDLIGWAHEQYSHFLAGQGRFQEAYEYLRLAQTALGTL